MSDSRENGKRRGRMSGAMYCGVKDVEKGKWNFFAL